MNPLELRKTILVGLQFASSETPPLIDPDGLPVVPIAGNVVARVVLWVPQKAPYQRRGVAVSPGADVRDKLCDPLEGFTLVHDVRPFELQALKDGAIAEEVYDFQYPRQPTIAELRSDVHPAWEKRTLETIGYLPNRPPIDNDPKLGVLFTSV